MARRSGIEIEGAKVALQGFGNVGSEAARLFAGVGARIVVIQDHTATLYNEGGIDMAALTAWQVENKQIAGFPGAREIAKEAFWTTPMDIRGIVVVPDVICNAGGVTVSYFEWVQDMASFFWSEEEINAKMDRIMTDAIVHVYEKAVEKACSLRTAAYIVACERILMARKDRGIYPG